MKTVFVAGFFNILHPGHLRLLSFAKTLGDRLVVMLYADSYQESGSFINQDLRLESIKSVAFVDDAFISNKELIYEIEKLKPDYVVKGKEYEHRFNPEVDALRSYGGKLIFSSGETNLYTPELSWDQLNSYYKKSINLPSEFIKRHNISVENILQTVERFKNLSMCVIGDTIVDEYISCLPLGMSQEDSTIVVNEVEKNKYIGGASIVAGHASELGAKTCFITMLGNDEESDFVKNKMKLLGVEHRFITDATRPTTLKQRFRVNNKNMFRVSRLFQGTASKEIQDKIFSEFLAVKDNINTLILSDFNYGCLPEKLVKSIIQEANKKNIFVAADSQSSSQIGNIDKFQKVDLIMPTEYEARICTRNREDGLIILAENMIKITKAKHIVLKMGSEGILIHLPKKIENEMDTDKISALNTSPVDVSGAGDSMLVATSMALSLILSIWEAALLGSIAAAIQVSRVGNIPIKNSEIGRLL